MGVEILAATPFTHDISVSGSGIDLPAGETKQLPPTLSVQWYPRGGQGGWQPYLGLGLNWTTFFDAKPSSELKAVLGENTKLSLDDSFGLAAQAGVDIPFGEHWSFNAGVWWIDIGTEATLSRTDLGKIKFDVDVDPLVYNIGIAYRF